MFKCYLSIFQHNFFHSISIEGSSGNLMIFGVHKICTCTLKIFIFEPLSLYLTRCVTLQDIVLFKMIKVD
jgi:hypothetical protein